MVVPASAAETVQETRASVTKDTAKEILSQIEAAYKSHTELAAGVMVAGDVYAVDEEKVLDTLKGDENVKEIFNDWTVSISARDKGYNNIETGIKFKVEYKDNMSVSAVNTSFISTGVDYYTADRVKTELGSITDLNDAVSSLPVNAKETDVEGAVASYISDTLLANSPVKDKYNVTVKAKSAANSTAEEGYAVTWEVQKITLTNATVSSDTVDIALSSEDSSNGIYVSWGNPSTSIMDKAVMEAIKAAVKDGFTISKDDSLYNESLAPDTDALSKINTWIAGKIRSALRQNDDFSNVQFSTNDISKATMLENGVWKGNITYKTVTETITIQLTKEGELDQTIVGFSLDDAKDIINIDDEIESAIPGLTVRFADGSHTTYRANKDGKIIDPNTGKETSGSYYYYDQTSFDTSKLGNISVEIKAYDSYASGDNAKVVYNAQVVEDTSYEAENFGGIKASEVESMVSSDEDVLQVVYDKTDDSYTLRAIAKGTSYITVVNNQGKAVKTKVTVSETGQLSYGNPQQVASASYIQNTPDVIGFTATDIESTSQDPSQWTAGDVVANASIEDGKIKFDIITDGTAIFKVTGGDNGKLEATITVKVENGFATITRNALNIKAIALNRDALETLSVLTFSDDDLGVLDPAAIFTGADDKILLKSDTTAGDNFIDTLPATDLTNVVLSKQSGAYKLTLAYGKYKTTVDVAATQSALTLGIDELGLTPDTCEIKLINNDSATSDVFNAEVKADKNGVMKVYVTLGSQVGFGDLARITVKDALGNKATFRVEYNETLGLNYVVENMADAYVNYTLIGTSSNPDGPDGSSVSNIVKAYNLGDEVEFDDLYLQSPEGNQVQITADMVASNYNTDTAFVKNDKLNTQYAKVTYAGFDKGDRDNTGAIPFTVKPAYEKFSTSSLDLVDGDTVSSIAYVGDPTITATLSSDKNTIEIIATKVEQSGAAVVTTKNGNKVALKINVDDHGTITTDLTKEFAESFTTINNDTDTLGIVGTEASSDNTDVATVTLTAGKVVLTSVNPGTATISVVGDGKTALINVSVDEFGTITVENIEKVVYEGFVRGTLIEEGIYAGQYNWYYYDSNGMVVSDWAEVNENGTDVWYHFDKDGLMQRGWIKDETGWKLYYLDFNGRMYHDTWANAEANEGLNMPKGMYYLQSDGAAQMNGWAKAPGTVEAYWYCAAGTGVFINVPENWAAQKLW